MPDPGPENKSWLVISNAVPSVPLFHLKPHTPLVPFIHLPKFVHFSLSLMLWQ